MNSKQKALTYLRDEADNLVDLCGKNKPTVYELEQHIATLFVAVKEVIDEFKLDEKAVETIVYREYQDRQSNK